MACFFVILNLCDYGYNLQFKCYNQSCFRKDLIVRLKICLTIVEANLCIIEKLFDI